MEPQRTGRQRLKALLSMDWDAIAGVIAAVLALVLHMLHVIETEVLLVIAVVLVALLFIRDLRRERAGEHMAEQLARVERGVHAIEANTVPPDTLLIGPKDIREQSELFGRQAQGEMVWFHVCLLMFKPQWLFDTLLRPAIENPEVSSVQFVLDPEQKALWDEHVAPKIQACSGAAKVQEPHWVEIHEEVSIILADVHPHRRTECLLSFWGDPFMSRHGGRDVPRYVFRVQAHSELVTHLRDLIRRYRLAS